MGPIRGPWSRASCQGRRTHLAVTDQSGPHVSNTPVRGYKQSNYEGGIITPLIVQWPGIIDPVGHITQQVGHVIDVMPTCLEIAGGSYPQKYRGREILPVEGKSLVPIIKGKQRRGHTSLFWELNGQRAVRSSEWKLVGQEGKAWELYNLQIDRGEMNDLADRRPDIVNKLGLMYREWSQRVNAEELIGPTTAMTAICDVRFCPNPNASGFLDANDRTSRKREIRSDHRNIQRTEGRIPLKLLPHFSCVRRRYRVPLGNSVKGRYPDQRGRGRFLLPRARPCLFKL